MNWDDEISGYNYLPEGKPIRKCLFCVISHFEKVKEQSDENTTIDIMFNELVKKSIPYEDLKDLPEESLCECQGDHHNYSSELKDAETVAIFFKAVIY